MSDYTEMQVRINSGEFENKMDYPGRNNPEYQQKRVEYSRETERLNQVFKLELEERYGVQNTLKKDKLWAYAWEQGHSSGLSEVHNVYSELVGLMVKDQVREADTKFLMYLLTLVESNLHTSASRSGLELREKNNREMEKKLAETLSMSEEQLENLWLNSTE